MAEGQSLTPQSGTEDLRVEPLLVLADLGRVAVRACVDRVDVHHRALTGRVGPQRLGQPHVLAEARWTDGRKGKGYGTSLRTNSLFFRWVSVANEITQRLIMVPRGRNARGFADLLRPCGSSLCPEGGGA